MNALVKQDAAETANLMAVITRAASDPTIDVDKLERLMSLYERIESRKAEQIFSDAMNAAQGEMRPVSQDAANHQTRSKYASFASLDAALRPIYFKHGFSLSFDTSDGAGPDCVRVVCKVAHKSGYSERPHLDMPTDGKGARGNDVMTKTHATMSGVSYARRGLLKMIFNIAEGEHDDDGNGAGGHANGPSGNVTPEQVAEMQAMFDKYQWKLENFTKFMKVATLADIPAAQWDKAIRSLREKIPKDAA